MAANKKIIDKKLAEYQNIHEYAEKYWFELDDGDQWWKGDWYATLKLIKDTSGFTPGMVKKIFGRDRRKDFY